MRTFVIAPHYYSRATGSLLAATIKQIIKQNHNSHKNFASTRYKDNHNNPQRCFITSTFFYNSSSSSSWLPAPLLLRKCNVKIPREPQSGVSFLWAVVAVVTMTTTTTTMSATMSAVAAFSIGATMIMIATTMNDANTTIASMILLATTTMPMVIAATTVTIGTTVMTVTTT
jgi:hypothetical protein